MLNRLIFLLLLAALCACNGPDPVIDAFPKPEILDISAMEGEDYSSVVLICKVSSSSGIKDCGFYVEKDQGFLKMPVNTIQDNAFSLKLTGLVYCSQYRYKAYLSNGNSELVSEIKIWTTENEIPPMPGTPTVASWSAGKITVYSIFQGDYEKVVRKDLLECGICCQKDNGTEPDIFGPHGTAIKIVPINPSSTKYQYYVKFTEIYDRICLRAYTKIGPEIKYSESVRFFDPYK